MREIKFRAWNKDRKEWAYLYISNGAAHTITHTEGAHEDWQQYTGLKDKNGKEIYEGDIVKYTRIYGKEIIAEIEWRSEDGCYYYFNHKEPVDSDVSNKESTFFIATTITEIIGNIYETPELIK